MSIPLSTHYNIKFRNMNLFFSNLRFHFRNDFLHPLLNRYLYLGNENFRLVIVHSFGKGNYHWESDLTLFGVSISFDFLFFTKKSLESLDRLMMIGFKEHCTFKPYIQLRLKTKIRSLLYKRWEFVSPLAVQP